MKPLTDICILSNDILDKKRHSNDVFDYIETNNVDLDVGKIISSIQITGKTAPNRARYILKENDILIPNARDCMRGVAIVPKNLKDILQRIDS